MKMIETVHCAERIVVTGEALLQRLLGRRKLAQSLLETCIDDMRSSQDGGRREGIIFLPRKGDVSPSWISEQH